jgi:hypothetical protein
MPWNGQPQHPANPDVPVRRWAIGPGQAGQVVFLVLEQQLEIHLLLVQWWGWPAAVRRKSSWGSIESGHVGDRLVRQVMTGQEPQLCAELRYLLATCVVARCGLLALVWLAIAAPEGLSAPLVRLSRGAELWPIRVDQHDTWRHSSRWRRARSCSRTRSASQRR